MAVTHGMHPDHRAGKEMIGERDQSVVEEFDKLLSELLEAEVEG